MFFFRPASLLCEHGGSSQVEVVQVASNKLLIAEMTQMGSILFDFKSSVLDSKIKTGVVFGSGHCLAVGS
jgi:hypothetical protein